MTKNIGEVKNHGVDIQVKTVNVKNKGFTWSTDFNISTFRNEVVALGPTGDPIMGGSSHITKIGHPIGMFYGYLTDGVFMNQAEVDRGPIFLALEHRIAHAPEIYDLLISRVRMVNLMA